LLIHEATGQATVFSPS